MERILDEDGHLAHLVIRRGDIQGKRINASHESEPLQVATIPIPVGGFFHPHIHLARHSTIHQTQEAWVVISGKVEVDYYDAFGSPICKRTLNAGDCSVSYHGGHGYRAEEDSAVYEFKTGPYLGVEKDKLPI